MPINLKIDDKLAIEFIKSWSVGGLTRYIRVNYFFLSYGKKKNLVKVERIKSEKIIYSLSIWKLNISGSIQLYMKNKYDSESIWCDVWGVCASNEIFNAIIMYFPGTADSPSGWMFKNRFENLKNLQIFGEIGFVRTNKQISREVPGLWESLHIVEYLQDHSMESYR
jgi:hypothetical protein